MNHRMLAALVALAGFFVALYLTLYKLGYIGTITCAIGSCETVQTSQWATLMGIPVGAWGVGYYLAVLGLCLAGLSRALADSRALSQALVAITGFGVLFSGWLTYLELYVIHAICMWCVISAILAVILFILAWLDWRAVTRWIDGIAEELRGEGYGAGLKDTGEISKQVLRND